MRGYGTAVLMVPESLSKNAIDLCNSSGQSSNLQMLASSSGAQSITGGGVSPDPGSGLLDEIFSSKFGE